MMIFRGGCLGAPTVPQPAELGLRPIERRPGMPEVRRLQGARLEVNEGTTDTGEWPEAGPDHRP